MNAIDRTQVTQASSSAEATRRCGRDARTVSMGLEWAPPVILPMTVTFGGLTVRCHEIVMFAVYPVYENFLYGGMAVAASTKLLALCTAAVGAVYAAGYVYTQPTAQASGVSGQSSLGGTPSSSSSPSASAAPSSSNSAPSSSSGSASGPAAAKVQYRDGTYTGSGANAYGTLSVKLTISGGKIASVKLTSYNMHYPSSFIYPQIANEVVQMQTYRVYNITGATASSYNFAEAVYYALQKAKA